MSRRGILALASFAVLGSSTAVAVAGPATSPTLVRTRAVLPGLSHALSLGTAPATTRLTVALGLAHPDPAGEQRLYQELYDPHSPLYRHFLTPAQYADRFGVRAATVGAAKAWLRSGGLTHVTADAAGDLVTATGTTSQLSKLMHTHFGVFRVGTVRFVANTIAPEVPAALPITAVVGLDTLHRMYTSEQVHAINRANGVHLPLRPAADATPYTGLLTPRNLWGIYDMPDTNMGQGQSAGLFMEGYTNSVIANLRVYERRHDLPQIPVRVVRAFGGSENQYGDNSGGIEWYLDSDAITGMAPKLRELDLYTTTSLFDPGVLKEFSVWADDPRGPLQMNASFGECEQSPINPVLHPTNHPPFYFGTGAVNDMEPVAEPILMHANLEGRTLFSSTGDTGGSCPAVVVPVLGAGNGLYPQPLPEQNYPAASPHVVAVAGTVEQTQGQPKPEAKASRATEKGWTYSGGGSSLWIAEPAYQKKVAAVNRPCLTQSNGSPYPPGTICRGVADVADMSGTAQSFETDALIQTNFYDIESDMSDSGEGGTSLSSPLATGMWSRIQAGAPTAKGLGFANETFYRLGLGKTYHRDFYDITQSETAGGNFYYLAGPGWDYVSGWGAMDVRNIMLDVDHRVTPRINAGPATPPMTLRGCAVMTSPPNNATNVVDPAQKDAALDIRVAGLHQSGNNLVVTISGPTLSTTAPTGASGGAAYLEAWTVGKKTYFAEATVDGQGNVAYWDGISTDSYVQKNRIQGTFSQHTITMTVPLRDVGNPAKGTVLAYPYAFSQYGLSGPTAITNPLYFTEDVATAGQPAQGVVRGMRC